jgi:phenylpyruvate tautomerase PptA (4-oxalocrotonate tautomerase family)
MPILNVELVGEVPDSVRRGLARRIADAAGEVLGSRPQGTWVTLRFLGQDAYAENAGGPPPGARPVLVSVVQAEPPSGGALAVQASRLVEAIALACSRPLANVHILFQPAAAGRIAFGGRLPTGGGPAGG